MSGTSQIIPQVTLPQALRGGAFGPIIPPAQPVILPVTLPPTGPVQNPQTQPSAPPAAAPPATTLPPLTEQQVGARAITPGSQPLTATPQPSQDPPPQPRFAYSASDPPIIGPNGQLVPRSAVAFDPYTGRQTGWNANTSTGRLFGGSQPPWQATPQQQNPLAPISQLPSTGRLQLSPQQQMQAFQAAGQLYGIDPNILHGISQRESGGIGHNPDGSPKLGPVIPGRQDRASGLMQFMPGTAAQYGVDVNNDKSSIFGAAKYLRALLDKNNGSMNAALAEYNGATTPEKAAAYVNSVTQAMRGGMPTQPPQTQGYFLGATSSDPPRPAGQWAQPVYDDGNMPRTQSDFSKIMQFSALPLLFLVSAAAHVPLWGMLGEYGNFIQGQQQGQMFQAKLAQEQWQAKLMQANGQLMLEAQDANSAFTANEGNPQAQYDALAQIANKYNDTPLRQALQTGGVELAEKLLAARDKYNPDLQKLQLVNEQIDLEKAKTDLAQQQAALAQQQFQMGQQFMQPYAESGTQPDTTAGTSLPSQGGPAAPDPATPAPAAVPATADPTTPVVPGDTVLPTTTVTAKRPTATPPDPRGSYATGKSPAEDAGRQLFRTGKLPEGFNEQTLGPGPVLQAQRVNQVLMHRLQDILASGATGPTVVDQVRSTVDGPTGDRLDDIIHNRTGFGEKGMQGNPDTDQMLATLAGRATQGSWTQADFATLSAEEKNFMSGPTGRTLLRSNQLANDAANVLLTANSLPQGMVPDTVWQEIVATGFTNNPKYRNFATAMRNFALNASAVESGTGSVRVGPFNELMSQVDPKTATPLSIREFVILQLSDANAMTRSASEEYRLDFPNKPRVPNINPDAETAVGQILNNLDPQTGNFIDPNTGQPLADLSPLLRRAMPHETTASTSGFTATQTAP